MITVHHLENSRSQRVLWLLEELNLEYEVKRYERDPVTSLAPPELYAVHPLGKSPVISDGDVTVAETGAIFEHILETYDTEQKFFAKEAGPARRAYQYWLHYAEGSAMINLLMKLVFSRLPERSPALMRPVVTGVAKRAQDSFIDPRALEHLKWWESNLKPTGYFVGDTLSGADIMMSFPLEAARSRYDVAEYRAVKQFLENIQSRPAYQRALERGGAYAYA